MLRNRWVKGKDAQLIYWASFRDHVALWLIVSPPPLPLKQFFFLPPTLPLISHRKETKKTNTLIFESNNKTRSTAPKQFRHQFIVTKFSNAMTKNRMIFMIKYYLKNENVFVLFIYFMQYYPTRAPRRIMEGLVVLVNQKLLTDSSSVKLKIFFKYQNDQIDQTKA